MSKGEETQERILERALRLASRDGLEGLTIGGLATELGMSKSGLFAHFRSKEELQLQVLRTAAQRFETVVIQPTLRTARGLSRLRALLEHWLDWASDPDSPGGCIFIAAATELDDRLGAPREYLVHSQEALRSLIVRVARQAVELGELPGELEPEQVAFELWGIVLSYHHARRLLGDEKARGRAVAAFERLVE